MKQIPTKQITISLPENLIRQITAIAQHSVRSKSKQIEFMLKTFINEKDLNEKTNTELLEAYSNTFPSNEVNEI